MVVGRFAALAVLAIVAGSASATYIARPSDPTPKCYANGERAIGAAGRPAVPYYPCCSGEQPRPRKQDYTYDENKDWGEFCGGQGNVVVKASNCHADGTKAIGAPGYPAVDYKPCCSKVSPREKKGAEIRTAADKWGQFCLGGSAPAPLVEPVTSSRKIRCAGAPGYPYVDYVFCGVDKKCAPSPKDGWGSFCLSKTSKDCVASGDRNEGAAGYPNVPYLPCCSGKQNVAVRGQWGRFCPSDEKKKSVIVVTAAPRIYKPVSTRAPTRAPVTAVYVPPAPKCIKAGSLCNSYGTKCCDGRKCRSSGYGPFICVKVVAPTAPPTMAPVVSDTMPTQTDETY